MRALLDEQVDNEKGIIQPRKGKKDPEVGADLIAVMIPEELSYLLAQHDRAEVRSYDYGFFKLYQLPLRANSHLSLSGPFVGAPQSVMGIEKMIALGARRIWALGWCGSLQAGLTIGDFLIPTGAISEEGTSRHYPIGNRRVRADGDLSGLLEKALENKGRSAKKGLVWSTDAPYRETPGKVKEYQRKQVMAVEMEMSALMTLAIYRSVKLAALLVVSDELFDVKWRTGFADPNFKKRSHLAADLVLGLVSSLGE